MQFETIITAVSVGAAALVSITSIFLPALYERQRRREERSAAESQAINEAALNNLTHLAYFQHWTQEDIQSASACRSISRAYSLLREKHFAWERAIWGRLTDFDRAEVRQIRERIMKVHTPNDLTKSVDESDVPALADGILGLTYRAVDPLPKITWWTRLQNRFR